MSTPIRIQRKRIKGWAMPKDAVYVGRPTKWGNPFKVGMEILEIGNSSTEILTRKRAVYFYKKWLKSPRDYLGLLSRWQRVHLDIGELRGKNLSCWCKEGEVCHADILLKLANCQ